MLELKLTKAIWDETDRRVAELPVFARSHRKTAANIVGCLGEVVVEQWLEAEGIHITPELDQTTHDYRLINGETFDVKTKDRTVAPRPDYDCSIPLYNHAHQRPDYYIFVSLQRARNPTSTSASRYHTAFVVGGINQNQMEAYGKVWKKGDIDPANGTQFWTDCMNVSISQLTPYGAVADKWYGFEKWQEGKSV